MNAVNDHLGRRIRTESFVVPLTVWRGENVCIRCEAPQARHHRSHCCGDGFEWHDENDPIDVVVVFEVARVPEGPTVVGTPRAFTRIAAPNNQIRWNEREPFVLTAEELSFAERKFSEG